MLLSMQIVVKGSNIGNGSANERWPVGIDLRISRSEL